MCSYVGMSANTHTHTQNAERSNSLLGKYPWGPGACTSTTSLLIEQTDLNGTILYKNVGFRCIPSAGD